MCHWPLALLQLRLRPAHWGFWDEGHDLFWKHETKHHCRFWWIWFQHVGYFDLMFTSPHQNENGFSIISGFPCITRSPHATLTLTALSLTRSWTWSVATGNCQSVARWPRQFPRLLLPVTNLQGLLINVPWFAACNDGWKSSRVRVFCSILFRSGKPSILEWDDEEIPTGYVAVKNWIRVPTDRLPKVTQNWGRKLYVSRCVCAKITRANCTSNE